MMKEIKLKIRCSEIVYQLGDGAIVASGISFGKKITPENLLGLPLSAISQIKAGLEQLSTNCDANSLCNSRTQLSDFFQSEIIRQKEVGKFRTAEIYATTMRSFCKFAGNSISFSCLTPDLIKKYELYLTESGLTQNTVGFYMRVLRSVCNKAAEQGIEICGGIFKNVFTGVCQTRKRALPISKIQKLKDLDLSDCPNKEFARNIFMFGLYCRGMSLVDIANIKKSDVKNGYLTYTRRKTGKVLTVKMEKPMINIIRQYHSSGKYLLPIIRDSDKDFRQKLLSASHSINRALRDIGKSLRLKLPLTMYVARHSWASFANAQNIPLAVISKCLGHSNQIVTQIYLDEISNRQTDHANKKVLDLIV